MKYLPIIILLALLGCKKSHEVTTIPTTVVTKPPVCGCTDPNALNFNPKAEKDDSSCKHEYDDIVGIWDVNFIDTCVVVVEYNQERTQITKKHIIMEFYKYGNDKTTVRARAADKRDLYFIDHDAPVSLTYNNHQIIYDPPMVNIFELNLNNKNSFSFHYNNIYGCPDAFSHFNGNGTATRIK